MLQTQINVLNLNNAVAAKNIRFWRDPIEFATFLVSLQGPQILSYDAVFDQDKEMLVKHRITKLPNPYLNRGLKKFSTTQVTVNFDYQKKVATFEGNVNAIDPQLKLNCKNMVVYFADKNNEVTKIEAFDDVHMYHEGKEAIGDKAVFTRDKGILIISGNKAKLRDEKGNWIASGGDGIIYNINTKQMKVDKPTLELIPSTTSSATQSPAPSAKP